MKNLFRSVILFILELAKAAKNNFEEFQGEKFMKNTFSAILLLLILTAAAQSQTFLQKIAGSWEGTLEYQDYQQDKRVKLRTYLTVTTAPDGNSAEFVTIYDDFGRIIKDTEIVKIDQVLKKYAAGDFQYKIDSLENGKIVLLGEGEDGEKVEPIRKTITFDENSLSI